jgi:hypothetical protein
VAESTTSAALDEFRTASVRTTGKPIVIAG